jgi:uncharacterized membrane protein (UPF0127 family)
MEKQPPPIGYWDESYSPMWKYTVLLALVMLAGCSPGSDAIDEFNTTRVRLPDGAVVRAEVMRTEQDMRRGMMFRESLAPNRGMLFIHGSPGKYPYWMYQVKVPLDIIWLDSRKRVVEISENTPPCTTAEASQCPNYGGNHEALIVLELAGGVARKHGIQTGATIDF